MVSSPVLVYIVQNYVPGLFNLERLKSSRILFYYICYRNKNIISSSLSVLLFFWIRLFTLPGGILDELLWITVKVLQLQLFTDP